MASSAELTCPRKIVQRKYDFSIYDGPPGDIVSSPENGDPEPDYLRYGDFTLVISKASPQFAAERSPSRLTPVHPEA